MKFLKKILKYNLNNYQTEKIVLSYLKIIDNDYKPLKHKIKTCISDFKIFSNSIKKIVTIIKQAGFNVKYNINKEDNCYEFKIKVDLKN